MRAAQLAILLLILVVCTSPGHPQAVAGQSLSASVYVADSSSPSAVTNPSLSNGTLTAPFVSIRSALRQCAIQGGCQSINLLPGSYPCTNNTGLLLRENIDIKCTLPGACTITTCSSTSEIPYAEQYNATFAMVELLSLSSSIEISGIQIKSTAPVEIDSLSESTLRKLQEENVIVVGGGSSLALISVTMLSAPFNSIEITGVASNVTLLNCSIEESGNLANSVLSRTKVPTHGGAIRVRSSSQNVHLSLTGSTFRYNEATGNGGSIAFESSSGSLFCSSSTFSDNFASFNGSAAFISGPGIQSTWTNSKILRNGRTGESGAGAIAVSSPNGNIRMKDMIFDANHGQQGSAMLIGGGSYVEISSSKFVKNYALSGGGGSLLIEGIDTIALCQNCIMSEGRSINDGGHILVLSSRLFELTDSMITTGESTKMRGGMLHVQSNNVTTVKVKRTAFTSGHALLQGGAVSIVAAGNSSTNVLLQDVNITSSVSNTAEGGGVYANGDGLGKLGTFHLDLQRCRIQGNTAFSSGGALSVQNDASSLSTMNVSMTDSEIVHNKAMKDGGGISLANNVETHFRSVEIIQNLCEGTGGALFCQSSLPLTSDNKGKHEFEHVKMQHNVASDLGGAMYVYGGSSLEFKGSSILDNIASSFVSKGGAIYATGDASHVATLTFHNCTIAHNYATTGGALFLYLHSSLHLTESNVATNIALLNGGAVSLEGGTMVSKRSEFKANEAGKDGGDLYLTAGSADMVETSSSGSESLHGGSLYASGGTLVWINSTVSGCSATSSGGAFHIDGDTSIDIKHFIIEKSSAPKAGAIYLENGDLFLQYIVIQNNVARSDGGGIWTRGVLRINDTLIINNKAHDGGGIFYACGVSFLHEGTVIEHNEAESRGGGLFIDSGKHSYRGIRVRYNKARSGGGIYFEGSVTKIRDRSIISHNNATENGGGIVFYTGEFFMENSELSYCRASDGAGISLWPRTTQPSVNFSLTNTDVHHNYADQNGGGIEIWHPFSNNKDAQFALLVYRSTLEYNVAASGGGGGIYSVGPVLLLVEGSSIRLNSASANGGAIQISEFSSNADGSGAFFVATHTSITSNSAANGAGISFASDFPPSSMQHNTFRFNSASQGGGALHWSGLSQGEHGSWYQAALDGTGIPTNEICPGCLFEGNSAAYGKTLSSLPYKLVTQAEMTTSSESSLLSPLDSFQILVQVHDLFGNIVRSIDGVNSWMLVMVQPTKNDSLITGNVQQPILSGVAHINSLKITRLVSGEMEEFESKNTTLEVVAVPPVVKSSEFPILLSDCPEGYLQRKDGKDFRTCSACPSGTYSLTQMSQCRPCPNGAVCLGKDKVMVRKDMWRDPLNDHETGELLVYKCHVSGTCCPNDLCSLKETSSTACAPHHRGTLCSDCSEGYSSVGGHCYPCNDVSNSSIILIVFITLLITVTAIVWPPAMFATVEVLIFFAQVLPFVVPSRLIPITSVSHANFEQVLSQIRGRCIAPATAITTLWLPFLGPVLFVIMYLLLVAGFGEQIRRLHRSILVFMSRFGLHRDRIDSKPASRKPTESGTNDHHSVSGMLKIFEQSSLTASIPAGGDLTPQQPRTSTRVKRDSIVQNVNIVPASVGESLSENMTVDWKQIEKNALFSVGMYRVLSLTYISLLRSALDMVSCREIGSRNVVIARPSLNCMDGGHFASFWIANCILICLYMSPVALIPLMRNYQTANANNTVLRIDLQTIKLREGKKWYLFLQLFRKAVLVSCFMLLRFEDGKVEGLRETLLCIVTAAFLLLHLHHRPYEQREDNDLETLILVDIMVLIAIPFNVGSGCHAIVIETIRIIAIIVPLLKGIHIVSQVFRRRRRRRRKTTDNEPAGSASGKVQVKSAPMMQIIPGKDTLQTNAS